MILGYLEGAVFGVLAGFIALYFAWSGFRRKQCKIFLRLLRMGGKIHRTFVLSLFAGLLLGCLGVWLCDGVNSGLTGFVIIMSCLLSASLTDLRKREIHLDAMSFYAALLLLYHLWTGRGTAVAVSLIGAVVGAVLLGIPFVLRRDAVGFGDIVLLAVCGMYYGAGGVVWLLFRALIIMAVVAVSQLLRKRATKKSELPIAPFLFIGALI